MYLDEIYKEINGVRAKRKENEQYVREKFYSLVIHGCLRITGIPLCTGSTKFGRERMHCDERRKDLIYRRGKFQSSDAFPGVVFSPYPNILSTLSPPFVRVVSQCF